MKINKGDDGGDCDAGNANAVVIAGSGFTLIKRLTANLNGLRLTDTEDMGLSPLMLETLQKEMITTTLGLLLEKSC